MIRLKQRTNEFVRAEPWHELQFRATRDREIILCRLIFSLAVHTFARIVLRRAMLGACHRTLRKLLSRT